jgi:hypothetical protein
MLHVRVDDEIKTQASRPEVYGSKAQLRTLQRRVGEWRSERAKEMVLGSLREAGAKAVEHQ